MLRNLIKSVSNNQVVELFSKKLCRRNPLVKLFINIAILIGILGIIAEYINKQPVGVEAEYVIVLLIKAAKVLALSWLAYESIRALIKIPKSDIPKWWLIMFSVSLAVLTGIIFQVGYWWFVDVFPPASMLEQAPKKIDLYGELPISLLCFFPVMLFVFSNSLLAAHLEKEYPLMHSKISRERELERRINYFVYFVDGPAIALFLGFALFSIVLDNTLKDSILAVVFLNGSTATLIALSAFIGPVIDHRLQVEQSERNFWLAVKIKDESSEKVIELAKESMSPDWWSPSQPFFQKWYKGIAEKLCYLHTGCHNETDQHTRTTREVAGVLQIVQKYLDVRVEEIVQMDVPCGYGRHIPYFAENFGKVIGVDINPTYLAEVKCTYSNLINTGKLEVCQSDMRDLSQCRSTVLLKNKVDLITNIWTSFGFFEHECDDFKTLQQFAYFLKPGGIAIIHSDINPSEIHDVWNNPDCQEIEHKKKKITIRECYDKLTSSMFGFWIEESEEGNVVISPPFRLRIWSEEKWRGVVQNVGLELVSFKDTINDEYVIEGAKEFVVVIRKPLNSTDNERV